jgi:hypothetical protein
MKSFLRWLGITLPPLTVALLVLGLAWIFWWMGYIVFKLGRSNF